MTETIRVIEVRSCGECPHSISRKLDFWDLTSRVIHKCRKGNFPINDISAIHPDCPLKSISVPLASLIDAWNEMHKENVETGYNKDMLDDKENHS
jgi:hypothetical protein